jgi:hypothetical protein
MTLNYTFTRDAITDFVWEDAVTKVWSFTKGNFNSLKSYSASLSIPLTIGKWWTSNNTMTGMHNTYATADVGGAFFKQGRFTYDLNTINSFSLPAGFKAEVTGRYNSAARRGNGLMQRRRSRILELIWKGPLKITRELVF